MTPTEAYRAALEAAATHVDGSARLLDELKAYDDALLCRVVAAAIRALPVPEGLDDADELDRLRAENERLRALAVKAQWALQPFADCVFDDNGDLTVTVSYRAVTVSALRGAYSAYRAIRSALKGGE